MRNNQNTISMFATSNPTEKYVVAIDGYFCYTNTKDVAEEIYNLAMHGSDGYIDNTPWGSIDIIPPHHYPKYINGYQPDGGIVDVTTRTPIDLVGYIKKNDVRLINKIHRKDVLATTTAKQRLAEAKEDLMVLLGMSQAADWRKNRVKVA